MDRFVVWKEMYRYTQLGICVYTYVYMHVYTYVCIYTHIYEDIAIVRLISNTTSGASELVGRVRLFAGHVVVRDARVDKAEFAYVAHDHLQDRRRYHFQYGFQGHPFLPFDFEALARLCIPRFHKRRIISVANIGKVIDDADDGEQVWPFANATTCAALHIFQSFINSGALWHKASPNSQHTGKQLRV